jgi:hypothetical protein
MNPITKTIASIYYTPQALKREISKSINPFKNLHLFLLAGGAIAANIAFSEVHSNIRTEQQLHRELSNKVLEVQAELDEKQKIKELERLAEEKRKDEIENPQNYDLLEGSETFELARLLYGEARGQINNEKLVESITDSVLTRRSLCEGYKIPEIVYDRKQYSCFNRDDPNFKEVSNIKSGEVWEKCYKTAEDALKENNPKGITHYWTDSISEPEWAKGKKPVEIVEHGKNKTRFYKIFKRKGSYVPKIVVTDKV